MPFADKAMLYHERGWNVLPIWPFGIMGSNGKDKPICAWVKWQKERQPKWQIEEWIIKYANCNIAIITGKISGFFAIDFDDEEACAAFQMDHILPKTKTVKTSKGYHFYFNLREGVSISPSVNIQPHVDVRGNGSYVIAPDSTHASGFTYVDYGDTEEIADAPESVYELLAFKKTKTLPGKRIQDWVADLWEGVSHGKRNDSAARLAGLYLDKGLTIPEVFALLSQWNTKNAPPLSDQELMTTVQSIANKEYAKAKKAPSVDPIPLDECKRRILKWLYYRHDYVIDVVLAVAITMKTDMDACWLILVGAPSTGKTELLKAFKDYKDVHMLDSMTPPAFISGQKHAKGFLEENNGVKGIMVFQDLSTFLSKEDAEVDRMFDILRQVYNGTYTCSWGSGKKSFTWEGKLNLIAAGTPAIERRRMAELGERSLWFRIDSSDPHTREMADEKTDDSEGKEKEMRKEILLAMHGALEMFKGKDIDGVKLPITIRSSIKNLAEVSSVLRSVVPRDKYRQGRLEYKPVPEGRPRMKKMMINLCKALAVVRGREICDEDDLEVIKKIAADSIPSLRKVVLAALIKNRDRLHLTAKDYSETCAILKTSETEEHLQDLAALGICIREADRNTPESWGKVPLHMATRWKYMINFKFWERIHEAGMLSYLEDEDSLVEIKKEIKESSIEDRQEVEVVL